MSLPLCLSLSLSLFISIFQANPLSLLSFLLSSFCPHSFVISLLSFPHFPLRASLFHSLSLLSVTGCKLQSDSRICPSWLCLSGRQTVSLCPSVCLLKKLIIRGSKTLCLFLPLCYLLLSLPASYLYRTRYIKSNSPC